MIFPKSKDRRIFLFPGKICNLACAHCNYHSDSLLPNNIFKSKDIIRTVLDWITTNGFEEIEFSGGEPLLAPNIKYWVSEALMKGLFVSIVTNGTIWESRERDILLSAHRVFVSLHGMDPSADAKTTLKRFAYKRSLETVAFLCRQKQHVAVHFCVNRFNCSHVFRLFQWASRVGVGQIKFLFLTQNEENSDFYYESCINRIEKENLWRNLKRLHLRFPEIQIRVALPLLGNSMPSAAMPTGCFLNYSRFLWSIYPDGSISSCCLLNSHSDKLELFDSDFNIKSLNSIKNELYHQMISHNSNTNVPCYRGDSKANLLSINIEYSPATYCPLRFLWM